EQRLGELLRILATKFMTEQGTMQALIRPDWTPYPSETSYGHDIEAAHLLIAGSSALGSEPDSRILETARRLVDSAVSKGMDRLHGGFFLSEFQGNVVQDKIWWVQAEALLGLNYAVKYFGS